MALAQQVRTPWLAAAFYIALIMPLEFSVSLGGLRLSPYRVVLLVVKGVNWVFDTDANDGTIAFWTAGSIALLFAGTVGYATAKDMVVESLAHCERCARAETPVAQADWCIP